MAAFSRMAQIIGKLFEYDVRMDAFLVAQLNIYIYMVPANCLHGFCGLKA